METLESLKAEYNALPATKAAKREHERTAAVLVKDGFVHTLEGDRYVTRARRMDLLPTTRTAPPKLVAGPLEEVIEAWVGADAVREHFLSPPRRDRKADRRRYLKHRNLDVRRMPNQAHPDGLGWRWMLPGAVRAMSQKLAAERRDFIAACLAG